MGVDISHLVLEALGDTNDQVVDKGSDGAEGSDIFPCAVVKLNVDDVLRWVGEGDSKMAKVLCEFACCRSFVSCAAPIDAILGARVQCAPLGPSTVTILVLMWTLTPSGTVSDSWECMYFILGELWEEMRVD